MKIAFYGSSILSSYWNGAATYYRGLLRALARLGHDIEFLEPDAFGRQQHRDIEPPDWCRVTVWEATPAGLLTAAARAATADVVVKASGVGYEDDALHAAILSAARPQALKLFWDVDAPATLASLASNPGAPLHDALSQTALVLTYGGGDPVVETYRRLGVARCVPVYNALDPDSHFPAEPDERFIADIAFLGNRLPDREARVEEFLLRPARLRPDRSFVLAGSGWDDRETSSNVRKLGHVGTADHNAFNSTPVAVLNVSRADMAANGFSPATRIFEAAGAGACIVTDAWEGIDHFLEPESEILVARDGRDVAEILDRLDRETARDIGAAARRRILAGHTYDRRAAQVDALLREASGRRREAAA